MARNLFTKKYKVENFDAVNARRALYETTVHILATGEEPDGVVDAVDEDDTSVRYVLKLYRSTGPMAGILVVTYYSGGASRPLTDVHYLDHFTPPPCDRCHGLTFELREAFFRLKRIRNELLDRASVGV